MTLTKHPSELSSLHLRIGSVSTVLCTNVPRLRREYAALYEPFVVEQATGDAIHLEVIARRGRRRLHHEYTIQVQNRHRFLPQRYSEVLPYVEWALNWELPRRRPDALWLHAASLECDAGAIILPGESGRGKSTLALALVARGWRYLCDEFAVVDARTAALRAFPRAICVKESGYLLADRLGYRRSRHAAFIKGFKGHVTFLQPLKRFPAALGRGGPARWIVFPKFVPKAPTTLNPIPRSQAVLDLHRAAFNLFGCQRPAHEVLLDLVRGALCHRMTSGDLDSACDVIEQAVQSPQSLAQSA